MTDLEIDEVVRFLRNQGFEVIRVQGNEVTLRLPE